MKQYFRSILFWIHLAAGLVAGSIIAVMSFTGAVLAFEHEIVEWAERDVRRIEAPAPGVAARPLDELLAAAKAVAPADAKPAGVTVSRDPRDAVAVSYGRDGTYYVNQYTGAVTPPAATRTHDFMHLMEDWHRRLAMSGDSRETGRAITGACNAAFLVLAVTGLYLWWPRQWIARHLRPALKFVGSRGKARDWNWHNVWGFWSLVPIIVMAATGMVFSYPWANALVYRAFGEEAPQRGGPPGGADEMPAFERPAGAAKLDYEAVFQRITADIPGWTSITLREGLPRRRGAGPGAGAGLPQNGQTETRPQKRQAQPYSATVKGDGLGPAFASTSLVINPFTGDNLTRADFGDLSAGRQARFWVRHLHTGYALGWIGQAIAALACIGGCILVYTGFALSWRRFFGKRQTV